VRGAEEVVAAGGAACNDPGCFRCRPSAHAEALARHSKRLRELLEEDATPALRGVSDKVGLYKLNSV
jgi:hypothetical protein